MASGMISTGSRTGTGGGTAMSSKRQNLMMGTLESNGLPSAVSLGRTGSM